MLSEDTVLFAVWRVVGHQCWIENYTSLLNVCVFSESKRSTAGQIRERLFIGTGYRKQNFLRGFLYILGRGFLSATGCNCTVCTVLPLVEEGKTGQDGYLVLVHQLVQYGRGQDTVPVPVQPSHFHQHQATWHNSVVNIRQQDILLLAAGGLI